MTSVPAGLRVLWVRIGRLEKNPRALAALKLVNVGLAMLWGFAVTFVFVRLLPIAEFRAFLLLVAFANFTVSADFGFSGIIYARLRRFRLGGQTMGGDGSDFHPRDIVALLSFMSAAVALGGLAIAAGIASGHIPTQRPILFLVFYLLTAANIFGILVKRALAAIDQNILWELADSLRRILSLALLGLALAGLPILLSVCVQLLLMVGTLLIGLAVIHGVTGMALGDWLLRRAAAGGVWRSYMRDMGTTMTLTLSDVIAYTAPYFGIAMVTQDPRPLLVFDFVYKVSRALSAVIRALIEAAMPRLTAAWHDGRTARVRQLIQPLRLLSIGAAAALGLFLLAAGQMLSGILFDGKAILSVAELIALALLLCGLAMLCVSTYVHNGVGRFAALLPTSFAFLVLSLLSVAGGAWGARATGQPFALCFSILYAATHLLLAVQHDLMLRRMVRA